MKRYIFSLQQKTVALKDPDQLIDKLVSFVFLVHGLAMKHPYDDADITVMDETFVWANMVSATTADDTSKETVTIKTTGKEKICVPVYLTAKADGTKLPTFIVFKGAK